MGDSRVVFLREPHAGATAAIELDGFERQTAIVKWVQKHPNQPNTWRVCTVTGEQYVGSLAPVSLQSLEQTQVATPSVQDPPAPTTGPSHQSLILRDSLLVFGILVFIGSLLLFSVDTSMAPHEEALVMARVFVERSLKAPRSAKHPPTDEARVVENIDGSYTVVSYVDSQNSFGAMIRSHYVCVLRKVDKENWRMESLAFTDQ